MIPLGINSIVTSSAFEELSDGKVEEWVNKVEEWVGLGWLWRKSIG